VLGFKINRQNDLKELAMQNEVDCSISKILSDKDVFQDVLYYSHYLECSSIAKISIGRLSKKDNGGKFVTVKTYIYYKLVKAADELDSDTFVAFHEILLLDAIIAASKKYKIPEENYRELLDRRSKLGTIPEWVPEMEDNPQLVIDAYKASVPT
jgi:hypothetical protein